MSPSPWSFLGFRRYFLLWSHNIYDLSVQLFIICEQTCISLPLSPWYYEYLKKETTFPSFMAFPIWNTLSSTELSFNTASQIRISFKPNLQPHRYTDSLRVKEGGRLRIPFISMQRSVDTDLVNTCIKSLLNEWMNTTLPSSQKTLVDDYTSLISLLSGPFVLGIYSYFIHAFAHIF